MLRLERYTLASEQGLPIAARREDGDYESLNEQCERI